MMGNRLDIFTDSELGWGLHNILDVANEECTKSYNQGYEEGINQGYEIGTQKALKAGFYGGILFSVLIAGTIELSYHFSSQNTEQVQTTQVNASGLEGEIR